MIEPLLFLKSHCRADGLFHCFYENIWIKGFFERRHSVFYGMPAIQTRDHNDWNIFEIRGFSEFTIKSCPPFRVAICPV